MPKFADRLRTLRNEHGMSQNDLAKVLGLSKSSINMYERGEREPGLETMEAIADFFNVDMDYLHGKSDFKNRNSWLCSIGPDKETPAGAGGRTVSVEDIKFALFGGRGEITDEMYNEVRSFAEYVAQREEKKEKTALLFSQPRPDQDLRVASPVILPTARKKDEE